MRLVIARMPALDAALIRFDVWWGGLTRRERILVAVMTTLLALVVLIYGVVKPLQSARAQAIADIRTYETLNVRIRAAGTLAPVRTVRRQGAPERVAMESAAGFGLAATPQRVPGGLRVTLADANYDSLLGWLADLAATSDLRVRSVSVQRRPAAGRVSAVVDFGA